VFAIQPDLPQTTDTTLQIKSNVRHKQQQNITQLKVPALEQSQSVLMALCTEPACALLRTVASCLPWQVVHGTACHAPKSVWLTGTDTQTDRLTESALRNDRYKLHIMIHYM